MCLVDSNRLLNIILVSIVNLKQKVQTFRSGQ